MNLKCSTLTLFTLATCSFIGISFCGAKPVNALTLFNTNVSTFTGGDIGEGLDLDGNFTYAIDIFGSGDVGNIRDANFKADTNDPGVTVKADFVASPWLPENYGDTINDNRLEMVMQTIRYSGAPHSLEVDLANLVIGNTYKAQLLFSDTYGSSRGFDIFAGGSKVVNRFSPALILQGISTPTVPGIVVSFEFTATDSVLNIVLDQSDPLFVDNNPILSGLTLEDTTGAVPTPALLPGLLGLGLSVLHKRNSRPYINSRS